MLQCEMTNALEARSPPILGYSPPSPRRILTQPPAHWTTNSLPAMTPPLCRLLHDELVAPTEIERIAPLFPPTPQFALSPPRDSSLSRLARAC